MITDGAEAITLTFPREICSSSPFVPKYTNSLINDSAFRGWGFSFWLLDNAYTLALCTSTETQTTLPLWKVGPQEATFWLVWASAWGQPCLIGVFRPCVQPTLPFPQAEGPSACSYLMEVTHLPHVTGHFLIRLKHLPNFPFCLLVFPGSFPRHGHQGALC